MIKHKTLIVLGVILALIVGISIYFNNRDAIVIWSHLSDKETRELSKIAKEWSKLSGKKVRIYSDRGDTDTYVEAIKEGKGPDVEFGIKEEVLGELFKQNLVEEMPKDLINTSNYVQVAANAVIYNNKVYAIPLFAETYALYYNKNMIKSPPQTLEELLELSRKYGFQYEINNIYYSYTFLEGFGAKIFSEQTSGNSIDSIDLGNSGAVKGYDFLRALVQSYKLMPKDTKFNLTDAKENFKKGKIGLYMSGMFDIETFNKSEIDFGVVPLPKLDGKELKSMSSIEVAFVSSKSKFKQKSWDFIKFVSTKTDKIISQTEIKLPTLVNDLNSTIITENPVINPFAQQLKRNTLALNSRELSALKELNNYLSLVTCEDIDTKLFGKLVNDYIKLEMLYKNSIKK